MTTMTWEEFVKEIERQMKEKGMPRDTPIWYMDFSFPAKPDAVSLYHKISVGLQDDLGMEIS